MGNETTTSERRLAIYLNGMLAGGLDPTKGAKTKRDIDYFMWADVRDAMESHSPSDMVEITGAQAFERSGRWHMAALTLGDLLSKETRRLTSNYEYPHGLPMGDTIFSMFLDVMVAMLEPSMDHDQRWWT